MAKNEHSFKEKIFIKALNLILFLQNYTRCSCVHTMANATITSGMCPGENCPSIYALIVGITIMVISTFLSFAPTLTVILR